MGGCGGVEERQGRTHLAVRAAGPTAPDVDEDTRRRAVLTIAGTYAQDAEDLAELLAALGLQAADGRSG
jgi:uncharacterized membrane-anchored protein